MPDLIFGFFIGVASTLLLSGLVVAWYLVGAEGGE